MKFRNNNSLFIEDDDRSGREILVCVAVVILMLGLIARMAYLQVYRNYNYTRMAESNRFKERTIKAQRGKIYDRYGRLIAGNAAGYRLIYLNQNDNNPKYVKRIAEATGYTEEYIAKRIKIGEEIPYTKEKVLVESLTEERAHRISEHLVDVPYINVEPYYRREYIYDNVASHVIGYVKKISSEEYETLRAKGYTQRDLVGKNGIEKTYDMELKGTDGYEYVEVNALSMAQDKVIEGKEPRNGKDLYLSLDIELQKFVEEEFARDGWSGAFVAIEPKTGEVLALVSYPNYSLNMFSSQIPEEEWKKLNEDPQKPLSDRVIAGEFPPGSIFKPISAMGFLVAGVDPKDQYMDYTGVYYVGNGSWRAWKAGGHGPTDMKKSIVESANPYYYKNAHELGYTVIEQAARDFGLGATTGIDVPGEKSGLIPSREWKKKTLKQSWFPGDTINASIGQGAVLTTPLQMAYAYCMLANRGIAYTPHVGMELIDADTGEIIKINGERKEVDKSKYTNKFYNVLNDALIATVDQNNGTTRTMRTPGIKIAAKSGSAQNPHKELTHAWVAGYFPAENPEVVFVTLLEGAGSGGSVAGALTKKIVDKYLEFKKQRENPDL